MGVRALIVFFSYTGNTRFVALALSSLLRGRFEVEVEEIQPVKRYPYLYWLILSFIPGLCTPIKEPKNDPSGYDVVFLGLPKWTFSCPPFNQYLREVSICGKTVGLFITYGGFDGRRYLRHMRGRLIRYGASVKASLLLKRRLIHRGGVVEYLREFCRRFDARAC